MFSLFTKYSCHLRPLELVHSALNSSKEGGMKWLVKVMLVIEKSVRGLNISEFYEESNYDIANC